MPVGKLKKNRPAATGRMADLGESDFMAPITSQLFSVGLALGSPVGGGA
jgi:hypothetical protein